MVDARQNNHRFNLSIDATNAGGQVSADMLISGDISCLEQLAEAHAHVIQAAFSSATVIGQSQKLTVDQRYRFREAFLKAASTMKLPGEDHANA
jgi:hypothetical protein